MPSQEYASLSRIVQVGVVATLILLHAGLLVWIADLSLSWLTAVALFVCMLLPAYLATQHAHRLAQVYIAESGFSVKVGSGWLRDMVDEQARRAGLAFNPDCIVYGDDSINAFVAGGSAARARLFISSACLTKLSRQRLAVIIAHEMSHIRNGDMIALFFMQGLFAALVWPLWLLWLAVRKFLPLYRGHALRLALRGTYWSSLLLTPLASLAMVIILRRWEYQADRHACLHIGKQGFVDTMRCVHHVQHVPGNAPVPFTGRGELVKKLLRSHPPLEQRIKAIQGS